ncbi:diguanylate cyclase [Thermoleophilia bacterium SCSIO 60948]|nr:diguanylate cyclase [Thermoleophilia bacterium SCSIO 60948]
MKVAKGERMGASFGIAALPEPALLVDSAGNVVELNRLAAETFDRPRKAGFPVSEVVAARPLAEWLASERAEPLRIRAEARRSDGVPITVELRASDIGSGALCLLRELPRDRFGGEAQRYFDGAFDRSPIGMALFDTAGRYTRVNDALCELLGISREELIGRRDQEFTHPDDRQSDIDEAWRILRGEIDTAYQHKRFVRPSGEIVWVIACMTFLRDDAGNPLSWVGQFVDVTDAKLLEADLRRLAGVDTLTGMPNRRALEERIQAALDADREGALLLIDIDGFKQINDFGGHPFGDQVLRDVGRAIAASVRRDDEAGRWGGDEFAVLIYDADPRSVERVSDAVEAAVADLDVSPVTISASVGSASFGDGSLPARDRDELLAAADADMYRRKRLRSEE